MARRNVVVGLDVGTTKIVALAGEVAANGQVDIIGFGEVPSWGLRKGTIVNIDETVRSIDLAIEKAERMIGFQISGVYVGITGANINSVNTRGVVAVTGTGREITSEDVQRVLQNARMVLVPPERRIVHVLPRQYVVDGCDGIGNPVGMVGVRLEVEAHIITGSSTYLQNIVKCIQRNELKLYDVVVSPLAAAEAAVLPGEKELGSLLVDIGGGTTDIVLYHGGSIWYTSGLPIGGDHITSDLAVGVRTTLIEAERVKRENGCVLAEVAPDNEVIPVTSIGGREVNRISRKTIASIMQPRVQEMFAMIREEVSRSGYRGMLPGGCILTGGTALIDGMVELAQEELQLPVRIGYPYGVGGLADVVNNPQYSTAVGLVLQAAKNCREEMVIETDPLLGGIWGRLRSWWKEMA
jgi:cell division protein FtsA